MKGMFGISCQGKKVFHKFIYEMSKGWDKLWFKGQRGLGEDLTMNQKCTGLNGYPDNMVKT